MQRGRASLPHHSGTPWVDLDRREMATPGGSRTRCVGLLSIGELLPGHGFDTVVAAITDVRNASLVIAAPVQTIAPTTKQEATRLRQLAVRLGVQDRVSVIGTATKSDVTGLLRSANIVVTTPRQHSSGVVALEAMACGLPVVASAPGALGDIVIDKITGRLVPPGNVPVLALTLLELIADPTSRETFDIAGADRVRARYAWDRIVTDALLVYQHAQFVHA